jgi:6-phosphogluconate dehydrogenase (decarboxylating)
MTDFMLRTDTEAQMDDALEAAGLLVEADLGGGEIALVPTAGVTLDRIGPIPAQVDEDNVVIRPGDSRYHANLRMTVELTPEQLALLPTFAPEPSVPYRVFL